MRFNLLKGFLREPPFFPDYIPAPQHPDPGDHHVTLPEQVQAAFSKIVKGDWDARCIGRGPAAHRADLDFISNTGPDYNRGPGLCRAFPVNGQGSENHIAPHVLPHAYNSVSAEIRDLIVRPPFRPSHKCCTML